MYLFDIVPPENRKPHWRFRVLGVSKTENKQDSELNDFLKKLQPHEIAGFMHLFARYCEHGKEGLTSHMFHSCDANRGLHQFVKGNHRITCFIEEGNIIICSHGFRKKSGKTPAQEQIKTDNLRSNYLSAQQSGELVTIDS